MSVTLLFLAVIAAIAGWWLSQQRLMAKPWLEEGLVGDFPAPGTSSPRTAKLGLGVFLAVAGSLLALFISAYLMRMHMAEDWRPLPKPGVLWLNTGILVLSSVALQWAKISVHRDGMDGVRTGLLAGGACALAFVVGQLWAWRQLTDAGYFAAANPANAFFYLITAIHGLHVLGGLVALGRTVAKVWPKVRNDAEFSQVRLGVELCAIYWHFLLAVWLVLFGLLLIT